MAKHIISNALLYDAHGNVILDLSQNPAALQIPSGSTLTNNGTISGGMVNPASGSVSGQWAANVVQVNGAPSSSNPGSNTSQIGWNFSTGTGEFDLFNARGEGGGGFRFWHAGATATAWTLAATLGINGVFDLNGVTLATQSSPPTAAGAVSYNGTTLVVGNGSAANAPTASEQYIPIFLGNTYLTTTGSDNAAGSYNFGFPYTVPSNFLATIPWALNIGIYVGAAGYTAYAAIWDLTAAAEVANSGVSTTSTTIVYLRSTAVTLTPGHQYCATAWVSGNLNTTTTVWNASFVMNPA